MSSFLCDEESEWHRQTFFATHICLPPKIRRCCTGGMPSFSSTRSFMRDTCPSRSVRVVSHSFSTRNSYRVVWLDVELNLLAGERADSGQRVSVGLAAAELVGHT